MLGQKLLHVNNIKGKSFISGDVSPNQAKSQALNEAKVNALKNAGIEEQISSYQLLFSSQDNNDFSQFFNSDIQSELQGGIQSYEIISEKNYCIDDNQIISEVVINADVIKYNTKPDITFDANVGGIKRIYINDEKLTFSIKGSQNSYLTIFNITDNEAFVLYPNEYEKQSQLNELTNYKFPIAKIDYSLHTNEKIIETNRLIFVFTKKPIVYIKMNQNQVTSNENIFSWIYSIMPDQRKVLYYNLSIQNIK